MRDRKIEECLLQDVGITLEECGGKAFGLASMQQQGFHVPAFFCLPASIMTRCLAPYKNQLDDILNRQLSIPQTAREIADLLKSLLPPQVLVDRILQTASALPGQGARYSVRSSGLREDGAELSFAGQYSSSLNVELNDLSQAVADCWRSAFSAHVLEYAGRLEVPLAPIGVVIQRMIDAELSGILFTANPQGLLNESVVVCGCGAGAAVADSNQSVRSYYYNQTDALWFEEAEDHLAPQIPDQLLKQLIEEGKKLQKAAGMPVDAEWALQDGTLWFLQRRPITSLPLTPEPAVLDNSNIVESYPGLSSPLTWSFVQQVYYGVFRSLACRCLPDKGLVNQYDHILQHMVATNNGRIYYRISNWYTILKFLPLQKKIIPIWQNMMGVDHAQYDQNHEQTTVRQRLNTWLKILSSAWGIPGKMGKLNQEFWAVQREYEERFHDGMENEGLLALYDLIRQRLLNHWDITLLNDMYAFVFTALVENRIKKSAPTDWQERANTLLSGISGIESMKPVRALLALADQALCDEVVYTALQRMESDADVRSYLEEGSAFGIALKSYIDAYGDRGIEELKLESPTFRVRPILLVRQLLFYLQEPEQLEERQRLLSEREKKSSMAPQGGLLLRVWLKKAKAGIANREVARLNRSRIFGMARSIFLQIGKNLYVDGLLESPQDIFWLTQQEIIAFVQSKTIPQAGFSSLVNQRKTKQERYALMPAYTRLVFAADPFDRYVAFSGGDLGTTSSPTSSHLLSGIACSPGRVVGTVLIVDEPHQAGDVRGKILVTKMTDPGWVFLLTTAAALISEKGSLLSHTAIISRELGIPAVVGVKDACRALQNGDVVQLDGNTGEIEVLQRG